MRPGEQPLVVDVGSREEALELAGKVQTSPGVAVEVLTIAEF